MKYFFSEYYEELKNPSAEFIDCFWNAFVTKVRLSDEKRQLRLSSFGIENREIIDDDYEGIRMLIELLGEGVLEPLLYHNYDTTKVFQVTNQEETNDYDFAGETLPESAMNEDYCFRNTMKNILSEKAVARDEIEKIMEWLEWLKVDDIITLYEDYLDGVFEKDDLF